MGGGGGGYGGTGVYVNSRLKVMISFLEMRMGNSFACNVM